MKCRKIGLVLGGGGTKGAYQLGALLALSKHRMLDKVTAVAATSIGAINLMLLLSDNLETGISLWQEIGKDNFLSPRKLTKIITGFKSFGLYSRSGLIEVLDQHVDFDKISSSKIDSYVTAAKVGKKTQQATYFKLNGASKDNIIRYVLASSAIPLVYEPILIDGDKYLDGGKIDNQPFKPLLSHDIDLLILIPLNTHYAIPEAALDKAPIIELRSNIFHNLKHTEGLKFDPSVAQTRMAKGFELTDELITSLRRQSIIAITLKEHFIRFLKKLFRRLPKEKRLYETEKKITPETPKK